jgi:hypothetical protein
MRGRMLLTGLTIGLAAALLTGSGAALAQAARPASGRATAGQSGARIVSASATAASGWRVTYRSRQEIAGVTAPSRRDAWAFGYVDGSAGQILRPFFLHWDGRSWRQVTIPAAARISFVPISLRASSAGNVWLFGYRRNAPQPFPNEALVFNGKSWSARPLPDDFNAQTAVVLSSHEVWSAAMNGCAAAGPCTSLLQEWNGSLWRSFTVAGDQNLAGAGDHLWSVGVSYTASSPLNPPAGAETLYRWTGTSWQRVAAPDGQVRGLPTAAVSPAGKLWILARSRGAKRSHLDIRSGSRWSGPAAPTAVRQDSILFPLTYDGHDGVWEVPYHWTGSRWADTDPQLTQPGAHAIMQFWFNTMAPVPGTASAWAVVLARTPSGSEQSAMAVFGPLP